MGFCQAKGGTVREGPRSHITTMRGQIIIHVTAQDHRIGGGIGAVRSIACGPFSGRYRTTHVGF